MVGRIRSTSRFLPWLASFSSRKEHLDSESFEDPTRIGEFPLDTLEQYHCLEDNDDSERGKNTPAANFVTAYHEYCTGETKAGCKR